MHHASAEPASTLERALARAVADPGLMAAGEALAGNDIPRAEALLRAHLRRAPADVAAMRTFA